MLEAHRKYLRRFVTAAGVTITIVLLTQLSTQGVGRCVPGVWGDKECDVDAVSIDEIPASELCATIPPFPDLSDALIVTPSSHVSWAQAATALAARSTLLITPGDYSAWGQLDLNQLQPMGSPGSPRVIRYYGPQQELHPYLRRSPSTEARIHGIIWQADQHDWIATGLTIRAPDTDNPPDGNGTGGQLHVLNADRITLDSNLIEDTTVGSIRVRDADTVCVQRNVLRGSPRGAEIVGVQIKPNLANVSNVRVMHNDIGDYHDAVQTTLQSGLLVPNFEIAYNDLFTTPAHYVAKPGSSPTRYYGCAENGVDIKVGNGTVHHNRIWGYRETPIEADWALCGAGYTSGSAGDAIIVHFEADGVDIRNNIIGDSMHALRTSFKSGGRHQTFTGNYVYNVPVEDGYSSFYDGAALVVEDDILVTGNTFANTPLICPLNPASHPSGATAWPPSGWSPSAPRVSENQYIGLDNHATCTPSGAIRVSKPETYLLRYKRKHLTTGEWFILPGRNTSGSSVIFTE